MDIEWAIDADLKFPDNIFIVQARPETFWSVKEEKRRKKRRRGYFSCECKVLVRDYLPLLA